MSLSNPMRQYQHEVGVSKMLDISHLNSPTVFECKSGVQGSVIHLEGVTFETEDPDYLDRLKREWHYAILGLNQEYSLHVTTHRRKVPVNLSGEFNHPFLIRLDKAYHERFEHRALFVNDLYLTVLTRPITASKKLFGSNFLEQIKSRSIKQARNQIRQENQDALQSTVFKIVKYLETYRPRLLGEHDRMNEKSELIGFLSLFLNAGQTQNLRYTKQFPPITRGLKVVDTALYPQGLLSQYLSNHRLFFGEYIQFYSEQTKESTYGVMLCLKRYGIESSSVMLDPLMEVECEYISSNTFSMLDKDTALKLVQRHANKLENANDQAASQIEELVDAQDMIASDKIMMGHHYNSIMLLSDSVIHLEHQIAAVSKVYSDIGYQVIRETIGQEPAFWAQVPGQFAMIPRSSLITSENYVDFCPLHNYATGYKDSNHLGSAVTLLETLSRTPYFFNFHVPGDQDSPSKGHTTIIGGNGSGKTVMMAFLDAQISRYQGSSFFFDRDRGLELYLRAAGGQYIRLTPDDKNTVKMNPFQLPDSPSNRRFCQTWFSLLLLDEMEPVLPADIAETVTQCVDYAYENLDRQHRTLSNVSQLLPVDFKRWPQLRRWLRASEHNIEGEYGYLFDNAEDTLSLTDKVGFDMTHFLDHEPKHVLSAITLYLFHIIESTLDGKLVSIFLDEGWQYLDNEYWVSKLKRWLPTLRKLNCHLIIATQSPSSVTESRIKNMILDNSATQIYFPNPQAKRVDYIDGFNLTDSEYQVIRDREPKSRVLLIKQENASVLGRLNLSHIKPYLKVLSSNKQSITTVDALEDSSKGFEEWLDEVLNDVPKEEGQQ